MRPDPTILAFDTSAAHCAAALLSGGTMTTRVEPMAKGQAESLIPLLEKMLADAGLSWSDLDAIGVGVGPGNFTGIRIAVSAARGLSLGLGKPAIGIDGFAARAFGQALPFTAEIPAPRGQAYFQDFFADGTTSAPRQDAASGGDDLDAETFVANIAMAAAERLGTDQPRPAPLYVRSADAAPPRDAAPRIIA